MSENGIEELAGLFTLPDVSPSADTILARETEVNEQEQKSDEKTNSNSGPRVSPEAAEKIGEQTAGDVGGDSGRGMLDSDGTAFDPSQHATDDAGRPKKTKTGKWAKKRGRKSNSTGYSQKSAAKSSADIEAENAGLATAQTIFTLGVSIGGDEWRPVIDNATGVNEPQQMAQAWAEYYKAAGVTNVPPWLTVVIACSCYALPRLTMPKTQTRLEKLQSWIGDKIRGYKKRKQSND